ncbi:hypothetical protein QDR66_03060 [Acinetobacter baumannii]|uniref:hypothetical protein n=1 Tax=Acinetobacter baumannii TaxID=470 RepID=UPI00244A7BCF|nr:hypothetical protein [Acinetobacter baumannii]MDH2539509.1 hypothetical protein [Acinetobacter baumannii]
MDKLELKNIAVEQGLDFDGVIELVFDAQQAKVEELQALYTQQGINMLKMQKREEALIQKYKDEDRELKLIDEWEQSTIYSRIAIELEQALKGEGQ